jgi:tRNA-Thr(GGU) m(6)t(6)A37 methyltransferase TsaA
VASAPLPALPLHPIGYLRTPQRAKFDARHQPADTAEERHTLELLPGRGYGTALRDLAGFDRIWLLWWFHRNTAWRPLVLPPRGPARRRGVFATRSPHRPNPLGLTPVRLLGIDGLTLHLGPCDLVDGTPVFDLKPYVPAFDAFPDAKAGWIDAVEATLGAPPAFAVEFAPLARDQMAWLRSGWRVDFEPRLRELLARDPSPHRTRRIRHGRDGCREIACGGWRALFSLTDKTVRVTAIETGFPREFLHREQHANVPDREAQIAFMSQWGEGRWARPAVPRQRKTEPDKRRRTY